MNEEKWIEVIGKIHMDNAMKERLYHQCIQKKYGKCKKLKFYKPVRIGAIMVCMLVSAPLIADVTSNVLERMQQMNKQEVDSLNDLLQAQKVEADSFSRALTAEEQDRKKRLLEAYTYKERFPEGDVKLVEGESLALENTLCYDINNSTFYLPHRPLSDEELLQLIDFNHKRDYSLQVMNPVEKTEVNMKDVKEMGLVEKAQYVIHTIYGLAPQSLESTIECQDEARKSYSVTFTEGKRNFSVGLEGEDLKVKNVGATLQNELSTYQVVTKEIAENETVLYEQSKDIVENVFAVGQGIKSAWCNYFIGDGGRAQDRKIHYLFELEDGSAYIFRYVQEEGTLYECFYMTRFSDYQRMMEQNDPKDLERGVKREQFEKHFESVDGKLLYENKGLAY